ncbi:MAG: 16S rRNA (adenine(1518)-N(6)/adenine(1519)-N(6))-dimethyltransferase RsmA [Candidatus Poribacteria bacterium]|nr:16S rRNA (adenine(1518)-N(6)/adenine(1519)-N(6))-dimethyltransferase RsmA [Candidatus Poribacteria bacterium]
MNASPNRSPRAKKRLGQHFLHDENVLARIVNATGITPDSTILEIGAGTGMLTRLLSENAGQVVAVEVDDDLLPYLIELARERGNLKIAHADFLKADLAEMLADYEIAPPIPVVGNLPYYITTPILEHLIDQRGLWTSATVMVQDEVAKRFCALPGTPECGAISVYLHYYCELEYLFRVGMGSFTPSPRVRSAVVRLTARPQPAVQVEDEPLFFRIVRSAFGQRRKTLRNAIRSVSDSPEAFEVAGIDPMRRGETLSMAEFGALANAVKSVV